MSFKIGKECQIHPSAHIDVKEGSIGDRTIIGENVRIEGTKVVIGKESFIDRMATIGGGSCFDPQAELVAGDWLHMGVNSHLNTARGLYIGHEFGCGIETKVFTHGAYSDSYNLGAPTQWAAVHIGDQVWCPNAWINPGVKIGDRVVVAARSLINIDLPAGCLAGGVPVKILKVNHFPQKNNLLELMTGIIEQTRLRLIQKDIHFQQDEIYLNLESHSLTVELKAERTEFNLQKKLISGNEKEISLVLKDQLRRNGLRFRFIFENKSWQPWS